MRTEPRGHTAAARLRGWWTERSTAVLAIMILLMVAAALWRLGNEVPRLLWDAGGPGGYDLDLRHREVSRWFAGLPVYDRVERGDYPPASYVLLWPFLGWVSAAAARWVWVATTAVALVWLGYLAARESLATTRLERLAVALLPFSAYATSATIRGGQLVVHLLPVLLAGAILLRRAPAGWRRDIFASALLLAALVKPTLSIPFLCVVAFAPGRLRPILLVSLGYVGLSVFAASYQEGDIHRVLLGWLVERPQALQGHANVHKWLRAAGLEAWMLPVSFAILVSLAAWVFRHRRADIWVLLGVTGVVAHFWIHHRLYDDLLILVPIIALFRAVKQGPAPDGSDVMAAMLLAMTWATMLAPASLLSAPAPWPAIMESGQTVVGLATLAFLFVKARGAEEATSDPEASSEPAGNVVPVLPVTTAPTPAS